MEVQPLKGIRVADFTVMGAGPIATLLLVDMGADVIKIEPPDGDPARVGVPAGFMAMNRGKKSIAVDLTKGVEAKEIVYKLISTSDVVAENSRPGVMEKLGFDYETLRKMNPDLIYLCIRGHGSTGPRCKEPSFDGIAQALSGLSVTQGGFGTPPVLFKVPITDISTPMYGAFAAMLCLYARLKRGQAQFAETSQTNTAIAMEAVDFIHYEGMEHKYLGGTNIRGLNATHRLYEAGDNKWLFVLCANETQWRSLCQVLGLVDLLNDARFETPEKRAENDTSLQEILCSAFRNRPAAEWLTTLEQNHVPVAPTQSVDDVLRDPHCLENDLFVEQHHPQFGRVRILGVVPRLSETPAKVQGVSPLVGEHTDVILAELGYSRERITTMKAKRVVTSPE